MAFPTNPNLAHLLVGVSVRLLLLTNISPKSTILKVGMVLCFAEAGLANC